MNQPVFELYLPQYDISIKIFDDGRVEATENIAVSILNRLPILIRKIESERPQL